MAGERLAELMAALVAPVLSSFVTPDTSSILLAEQFHVLVIM